MKSFITFLLFSIGIAIGNCQLKGNQLIDFNKIKYDINKINKILTIEPNYFRWVSSVDGEIKGLNLKDPSVELSDPFQDREFYFGNPVIGTEYSFEKLVNPSMACEGKYFNLVGMMNYILKNKTEPPSKNPLIQSHSDISTPTPSPTTKPISIYSFPNITLLTILRIKITQAKNVNWGKDGSEVSTTFRKGTINIDPLEANTFPKSYDHHNNILYLFVRERSNLKGSFSDRKNFIVVFNVSSNKIIEKEIITDLLFESIAISGFNNSLFMVGQKQNSNSTYLYEINYSDQQNELKIDFLQTIPLANPYQQVVCENSRFLILYSNLNRSIIKFDLLYKNDSTHSTIIETDVPIMPIGNSKIMAIAYVENKELESIDSYINYQKPFEEGNYSYNINQNNGNYQNKKKLSNNGKIALAITIPFAGFLIALGITVFIIINCKRIKRKNRENKNEIKTNNPNEEFETTGADDFTRE
ncbi:hypothetical protein ACTFIV_002273 [Dictyostelium citrinum]